VFQDEVEIHRHPTLSRMWGPVGKQPEIPAPGQNEKKVVYGGVDYATGKITYTICQRVLKTSHWGRDEKQPFCKERNSSLDCSNTLRVACDCQWRISSKWRSFSRYNSYTPRVGRSGGLPESWRSTAVQWHDTYDRHHPTQNQPFCPPAPRGQKRPHFRPSRL
jgi:hypothetical protein